MYVRFEVLKTRSVMITVLLGTKLFSLVGNAGTLRLDCVILGVYYYYYYHYYYHHSHHHHHHLNNSDFNIYITKALLYSISYYPFSKCFLMLLCSRGVHIISFIALLCQHINNKESNYVLLLLSSSSFSLAGAA
jgi:hypothetical protein